MPPTAANRQNEREHLMVRNLKAIGSVFAAVFAVGGMASTASAIDVFTASKSTALVTGISHDMRYKFTAIETEFGCTAWKLAGTFVNGASEMTVETTYTGGFNETPHGAACTSTIGQLTYDMNGCHERLTGSTTGSDNGTDATVWIECPEGKVIKITGPQMCTVEIPGQTPSSGGVTYTNLPNHAGGSAIKVIMTMTGLTYKAPGIFCAMLGFPAHGTDLHYRGSISLTGYEDKNLNTTTLTPASEGARVPISFS